MKSKLLSAPYIVWMILFTLIPLCIVFYYALTDSITGEFTLANLASMGTWSSATLLRTLSRSASR